MHNIIRGNYLERDRQVTWRIPLNIKRKGAQRFNGDWEIGWFNNLTLERKDKGRDQIGWE